MYVILSRKSFEHWLTHQSAAVSFGWLWLLLPPLMLAVHRIFGFTGTLLGIFVAYGFVNPLANRIKFNNSSDQLCLKCIMQAVSGFAKGLAPLTAIEVARRSLDSSVQPAADELEIAVKGLGTGNNK